MSRQQHHIQSELIWRVLKSDKYTTNMQTMRDAADDAAYQAALSILCTAVNADTNFPAMTDFKEVLKTFLAPDDRWMTPLHHAAAEGDLEKTKLLLAFARQFSQTDYRGAAARTAAEAAASAADTAYEDEHSKAASQGCIDIEAKSQSGDTAYHLAVSVGKNLHVVSALELKGARRDALNADGKTAAQIGVAQGFLGGLFPSGNVLQQRLEAFKRAIKTNDLEALTAQYELAPHLFHEAEEAMLTEAATNAACRTYLFLHGKLTDASLIAKTIHLQASALKERVTVLHAAAAADDADAVTRLLDLGADVNTKASHDLTPLHVAARAGSAQALSALLEKDKSGIDNKTRQGHTPLEAASLAEKMATVDVLLEADAVFTEKNVMREAGLMDGNALAGKVASVIKLVRYIQRIQAAKDKPIEDICREEGIDDAKRSQLSTEIDVLYADVMMISSKGLELPEATKEFIEEDMMRIARKQPYEVLKGYIAAIEHRCKLLPMRMEQSAFAAASASSGGAAASVFSAQSQAAAAGGVMGEERQVGAAAGDAMEEAERVAAAQQLAADGGIDLSVVGGDAGAPEGGNFFDVKLS